MTFNVVAEMQVEKKIGALFLSERISTILLNLALCDNTVVLQRDQWWMKKIYYVVPSSLS